MNILSHILYDLLSSHSCASFATPPVSESQLQTSVEGETSTPPVIFFFYSIHERYLFNIFQGLNQVLTYYIYLLMGHLGASFNLCPRSMNSLGTPQGRKCTSFCEFFFNIYSCICQTMLFQWTYCHILYMICYPHTLVHLLRPHRCPYLNYRALQRGKR